MKLGFGLEMASEAAEASSSGAGSPEKTEISQTIRSCRGCLLYSSIMREHGRNPVCLGLSRNSEPEVFMVHNDLDSEAAKNSRNFRDFKYACIGYSAHKEVSSNQTTQPIVDGPIELPYCVGLEFLADPKPTRHAVPAEAPSPSAHSAPPKPLDRPAREDGPNVMPRPPSSIGGGMSGGGLSPDEFATRFFRTSRLVATAVVNNLGKVANNVRTTIDKILTSDQGRPKA